MDLLPRIKFLSGFIAGTVAAVSTWPLSVVQVQRQVQIGGNIRNTVKNIYKKQGIKGYYCGVTKGIICYSLFYGTFFCVYGHLKATTDLPPFFTSYMAAAVGSIISNPSQVVRVRCQTAILKNKSNHNLTILGIVREEGFGTLLKGIRATLLKNCEISIVMTIHEYLSEYQIPVIYSSAIGKITAASITYPIDSYRSIRRYEALTFNQILNRFCANPKIMYNGYLPYLIKSVPATGIVFYCNNLF
uniref:Mitochondrial carrier-like protein n=1 Tax=Pithovirus LCPAC304 TaxID=2506594 RepID=A0A481Z8Y4_9VIRU|nr:MAG: mitochondrial carrier-like protein [Pithovirus LCPAC304]